MEVMEAGERSDMTPDEINSFIAGHAWRFAKKRERPQPSCR
jgi:hypothetical protein